MGSLTAGLSRRACAQHGTSLAAVIEVAAGEQRHVMALRDQFLGQIRDDALGSAVEARGHTFHQRRNLGDFHVIGASNRARH